MSDPEPSRDDPSNDRTQPLPQIVSRLGPVVSVPRDMCERLSDISSVLEDVSLAAGYFNALAPLVPERSAGMEVESSEDPELAWSALFTAGTVSYGRAFTSGSRRYTPPIEEILDGRSDEADLRRAHQEINDYRNGYVAHSLGTHETLLVGLLLAPPPLQRIIHLQTWHGRLHTLWREDAVRWGRIAQLCVEQAARDMTIEQQRILAGIDPPRAYSFPPLTLELGTTEFRNGTRRKRHRNA